MVRSWDKCEGWDYHLNNKSIYSDTYFITRLDIEYVNWSILFVIKKIGVLDLVVNVERQTFPMHEYNWLLIPTSSYNYCKNFILNKGQASQSWIERGPDLIEKKLLKIAEMIVSYR